MKLFVRAGLFVLLYLAVCIMLAAGKPAEGPLKIWPDWYTPGCQKRYRCTGAAFSGAGYTLSPAPLRWTSTVFLQCCRFPWTRWKPGFRPWIRGSIPLSGPCLFFFGPTGREKRRTCCIFPGVFLPVIWKSCFGKRVSAPKKPFLWIQVVPLICPWCLPFC